MLHTGRESGAGHESHSAAVESGPDRATAIAHPNIALVKYWGKRDESLMLPVTDSLSMTVDIFPTVTTVSIDPQLRADTVIFGEEPAPEHIRARVTRFLDLIRELAGASGHAVVHTRNSVPTGAGLASSASGFAALALAAATAYGLRPDPTTLSRLARRGSGSACRSVHGGFALWHAGAGWGSDGDHSSYAEQLYTPEFDPAMVITVVDNRAKRISSRDAMHRTLSTSPLYLAWANTCAADIAGIRAALGCADLDTIGRIAEHNALGMHATMLAARPPIRYLSPKSVAVLDRILHLREQGLCVYATVDAGPNVVALCHDSDAVAVAAALGAAGEHIRTFIARPGPGAALVAGGGA